MLISSNKILSWPFRWKKESDLCNNRGANAEFSDEGKKHNRVLIIFTGYFLLLTLNRAQWFSISPLWLRMCWFLSSFILFLILILKREDWLVISNLVIDISYYSRQSITHQMAKLLSPLDISHLKEMIRGINLSGGELNITPSNFPITPDIFIIRF